MKKKLTENDIDNLKQLVSQNKKIETIKYIRNITGFGLKESKDICDTFFKSIYSIENFQYTSQEEETEIEETFHEHENQSFELNIDELNFVKMLLQKGQKLQAVKYVKELLATGLKEAKEYVDALEAENKTTETFIFGQDKNLITESEVEDEPTSVFEPIEKPESISKPEKKQEKKKRPAYQESEAVVFGKSIERDKRKEKRNRQSNSGCMLMLTFMFVGGLLIIGGILYL